MADTPPLDEVRIVGRLRAQIAGAPPEVPESEVDPDDEFEDYGLASSDAVFLSGDLSELPERQISATLAWDYPTINKLAAFLAAVLRGEADILHGSYLDLDQESGIGQRRDADNGARRQVRLAAAEKLRVAFHEGFEIHRRAPRCAPGTPAS